MAQTAPATILRNAASKNPLADKRLPAAESRAICRPHTSDSGQPTTIHWLEQSIIGWSNRLEERLPGELLSWRSRRAAEQSHPAGRMT